MAVKENTLWQQLLEPIFSTFLLDREKLNQFKNSVNWEQEIKSFSQPNFSYPDYYLSQNFHGIENGYLTPSAAVTYDPITQYVLPPHETWVRQEVIKAIQGNPQRILDLGCGTGSTTLLLKQAFPTAEVIGLDLSPYMLFMADYKAKNAELNLKWQQGKAEKTNFPPNTFDVVTASLLFHETPPHISELILQESFRLLKAGGQVIILDGNQKTLRQTQWLTNIFEEPYIQAYAQESVEAWLGKAGFEAVQTEDFWGLHQISRGIKPLGVTDEYDQNVSFESVAWSV